MGSLKTNKNALLTHDDPPNTQRGFDSIPVLGTEKQVSKCSVPNDPAHLPDQGSIMESRISWFFQFKKVRSLHGVDILYLLQLTRSPPLVIVQSFPAAVF